MHIAANPDRIFGQGEKASTDYFTGTAWVKPLVNETPFPANISNVTFEPGARNHWHTHPGGQVLLCTEGTGYYQEKGKPIQLLHKGDLVKIHPDIEHWHGASPRSWFTHIAISTITPKAVVEWLRPVTDEEYNSYSESE